MVIQRTSVQNLAVTMPGKFATSVELTSAINTYSGSEFHIIKPGDYTPCLTVGKKTSKIVEVVSTVIGKSRNVFDTKVGTNKIKRIPANYTFHFNLNGKVLGVKRSNLKDLNLGNTKRIVKQSGLVMAPLVHLKTRNEFVGLLLKCLLDEDNPPWDNTLRTGFYIGDTTLQYTNRIALSGAVAAVIPSDVGVLIKGIFKHAPDHSETVFWFELKQCAPTIFEILKEEDLTSRFMETLVKCL